MKCIAVLSALLCASSLVHANTNIWTGLGSNSFWTTASNWDNNVLPVPGNDLVFPSTARNVNTNNFPSGTLFNSITVFGPSYTLRGSNILLNAGLYAPSNGVLNSFDIPLTLNSNAIFTSGGATLTLRGEIDINGNDLYLGGITGIAIWGPIIGNGRLIKTNDNTLFLHGNNTFASQLEILQGQVSIYQGNELGTTNGSTTIAEGGTLDLNSGPMTLPEPLVVSGRLIAEGSPGDRIISGPITLVGTNASIELYAVPLTIDGLISGSGFSMTSSDVLTLMASNTYSGPTKIMTGILRVNNFQPNSPIILIGGSLGGTGTVGTVTAIVGSTNSITPGPAGMSRLSSGLGILTCSNISASASTRFAFQINGTTPGTGHDQIRVRGSVALGNAILQLTPNLPSTPGQSFVLIDNDGGDPVIGTFVGLPQGKTFAIGTHQFLINYSAGDGNDLVLTRLDQSLRLTGMSTTPNGITVHGLGVSNLTYTIQAVAQINDIIWSNLGTVVADQNGVLSFTDTNAPLFAMRFYRALAQ